MKRICFLSLSVSLLCLSLLSSCGAQEEQRVYKLSLDDSVYTFSQYDAFSKDGFNVYRNTYVNGDLVESSLIDDYTVELTSNKETIADGYVFMSSGLFAATVTSDGAASASFTFKVNNSKSLEQTIVLNSLPMKTHYALGEGFDSAGLSLSLRTEYRDSNNQKTSRVESISEYEISIDGIKDASYIYEEYGIKRADVSYEGYEETLHLRFSTFCLKNEYAPEEVGDKTLMGEDDYLMSLTIKKEGFDGDNAILTPDQVSVYQDLHDFSNRNSYIAQRYAPSVGHTPLLVVPVVIPGYENLATEENMAVIQKSFMGTSNDLHFESLHSYYYKSSYGQLDFRFTITDYYYLETDSESFNDISSLTGSEEDTIYSLSKDCLSWAQRTYNLDLKDYDSDANGAVDGIWMVYMAPYKGRGDVFWAFSGYGNEALNVDMPVANTYGWISYQFLKGEYAYDETDNPDAGLDAHVLIHETGHMLGLNDYYDSNKTTAESASYDPLGSIDMMSTDVGDMNPYSKLILGWVTPYVIYGNASLDLKSCQSKNNVVIIYDDGKTLDGFSKTDGKYRINLFDEYLVLDYYKPGGLNSQDYPAYNIETVKEEGLRIYHVDNRLTKVTHENGSYSFNILEDPDSVLGYEGKDLYRGITNTLNETIDLVGDDGFDEVRWISSSKERFGYYSGSSHRVFKSGESFSIASDDPQFKNGSFDDGASFSYEIGVHSIN